jgi:hypothetical protein
MVDRVPGAPPPSCGFKASQKFHRDLSVDRRERNRWLIAKLLEKMKAGIIIHCYGVGRLVIKKRYFNYEV